MYTCGIRINAKLAKEGNFRINAKLVKDELIKLQLIGKSSETLFLLHMPLFVIWHLLYHLVEHDVNLYVIRVEMDTKTMFSSNVSYRREIQGE